MIIAIDGPAASGKGTLAALVAEQLGYHYLDSGALYRVTAHAAVLQGLGLDASHETQIAALARQLPVRFEGDRVWLGTTDVTDEIRSETGGMRASLVSALPQVRLALVDLQHRFARLPGLVADGRDMGSVVFPSADLKVFLTASAEERAMRRHKQLKEKGIDVSLPDLSWDIAQRDARDANRAVAPLRPAPEAHVIDSTSLSPGKVVARILERLAAVGVEVERA